MRVLILGGDGYLGWPTAMAMAARGHDVTVIDNYLRRRIAMETCSEALITTPNLVDRASLFKATTGHDIKVVIGNCADYRTMTKLFVNTDPEVVIHYAEQPSAPYSMIGFDEASLTLNNNLNVTFNLIWAVREHKPECHIIKLGTMGEYGTPNIDIEEGWIDIDHKGRSDRFLYPRQAGSLYHTTKVLDTDLLWFYVRTHGLRVTDLMQGPVYGLSTDEADMDERLMPNFHYDDIFGTALNRFIVQAVAGEPLTVYGKGGQTRGYLNLRDTLQCVELAMTSPAEAGQLRIFNQFTEVFSVNELAALVKGTADGMGIPVTISHLDNPRKEKEDHYYNVVSKGLDELGLDPVLLTKNVMGAMIERVTRYKERIDRSKIRPRISWS